MRESAQAIFDALWAKGYRCVVNEAGYQKGLHYDFHLIYLESSDILVLNANPGRSLAGVASDADLREREILLCKVMDDILREMDIQWTAERRCQRVIKDKKKDENTVCVDVWCGELHQDHAARFMVPLEQALHIAKKELASGNLVNLRKEASWGEDQTFDNREGGMA